MGLVNIPTVLFADTFPHVLTATPLPHQPRFFQNPDSGIWALLPASGLPERKGMLSEQCLQQWPLLTNVRSVWLWPWSTFLHWDSAACTVHHGKPDIFCGGTSYPNKHSFLDLPWVWRNQSFLKQWPFYKQGIGLCHFIFVPHKLCDFGQLHLPKHGCLVLYRMSLPPERWRGGIKQDDPLKALRMVLAQSEEELSNSCCGFCVPVDLILLLLHHVHNKYAFLTSLGSTRSNFHWVIIVYMWKIIQTLTIYRVTLATCFVDEGRG